MDRFPFPHKPRFDVRPRESVQFTGPESVDAVAELVRKYRPGVSHVFNPVMRTLTFYGGGQDLELKLDQWAAVIHGREISIIPPALFGGSPVEDAE